jgi:hypothetical protein
MSSERWARLKAIFHGALAQPEHDRRAWLRRACGDDKALLQEAETLLQSLETAGGFLEEPARLDPADVTVMPPGTTLGPYQLVDEIGRGGMGVVYLAEDSRLGRKVALKALPPDLAAIPEFRQRLRREARAAATISHPAVATVYALEEIDDHLIIVSEYVNGETLRAMITHGAIESGRARAIAVQVARALCAAHDAGVVHRDLKPENVLITSAGDVKVVDFGIAHVEGSEATRLTRAGALLGTPAYMAPEQLLGGPIDARADIYAFGVLLSEMVTGRHPLSASAVRATPPPEFAPIIARCIQADPAARYRSARELIVALEGTASGITPGHVGLASTAATDPTLVPAATGSPRWWWEFHQAMAALVYWLMTIPAWRARELIGGGSGRVFFIVTLVAVIVAANLRLHLWFTSRFYPSELRWARRRVGRWIRAADWIFVATLVAGGLVIGEDRSPLAILLIAVGIGAALAFLVIERATTRAAFLGRRSEGARST